MVDTYSKVRTGLLILACIGLMGITFMNIRSGYYQEELLYVLGTGMIAIGALFNLTFVVANGNKMPVVGLRENRSRHKPFNKNTKFKLLADIFRLRIKRVSINYSVGDVFIYTGFIFSIITLFR